MQWNEIARNHFIKQKYRTSCNHLLSDCYTAYCWYIKMRFIDGANIDTHVRAYTQRYRCAWGYVCNNNQIRPSVCIIPLQETGFSQFMLFFSSTVLALLEALPDLLCANSDSNARPSHSEVNALPLNHWSGPKMLTITHYINTFYLPFSFVDFLMFVLKG